ncbi:cellulose synthase-like protein H1 [Momordica charantia]|uniref:Cellulose synthase-like protein H1 n=1 Tax=Momordica charantia TaxID=3673 RepID=A0A6J1CHW9_MOMCH|nr:cellulose synthase-like protein H1 [Momordica charantia]
MAKSLSLYEKTAIKRPTQRALDFAIFFLLLSLVGYRFMFLSSHGFSYLQTMAFLCESWFSFVWLLAIIIKWNPVDYKTYPHRLLKREVELPAVDIFVTTADPVLEPPIITVNTVLSLMAMDYPAKKLACYVSDDGCSPVTFYSLREALKFAKIWVPFCKKYEVEVRAPFRYFLNGSKLPHDLERPAEFKKEWKMMKEEYELLEGKIEEAEETICGSREPGGELADFFNIDTKNHPTIIKILWENKEGISELPHLIYLSREKSLKHPHHSKAGTMNVMTRVSGLLTNAPYLLNVDCDMFANNPQVVKHAMCVFFNSEVDFKEIGFVQSPQCFYDGLKDDVYGNQLVVVYEYFTRGIMGLQGPLYSGTGCFHRRKIIYGQSPHHTTNIINEKTSEKELLKSFGYSQAFIESATCAFDENSDLKSLLDNVEAADQVARCGYENGTSWGSKVGWIYGSTTEDVQTGLMIQKKGWRSIYIALDPPAFLGCAPSQLPNSLTQQKRWATGLLEILFSKNCPVFATLFGNLQIKQCAAYLWLLTWGLRSIPELCYAALPAYCLITNSHFLPNVQEPTIYIPISLFIVYNFQQLLQYYETGQSIRAWWNNQRMGRINTMCAWFFGVVNVVLKLLGMSETVFEVTKKETSSSKDDGKTDTDSRHFTFDESPKFVMGTTILLVHVVALLISLIGERWRSGVLEMICSLWLVLCFWPFLKGLFGKGSYGLPLFTVCKSVVMASVFVHLCHRTTMN